MYRSYTPASAQRTWGDDEVAAATDPATVAADLVDAAVRAGCDALNLRVHVPGVDPAEAREQISRLGADVLPTVRRAVSWRGSTEEGMAP